MYGINDRHEIELPLNEVNEYLTNVENKSINEKRKFCSVYKVPILMEVLLSKIEQGDAGYYVELINPITKEIFNFSFAEWQFKDQEIEEFCDKHGSNFSNAKEFMLEFQWSKIKEVKYRGFEVGNIETGKIIEAWTLISIYQGWTVPE